MRPAWWNLRSPRYWLVVAAAAPAGLLLGALLTTHFARPPADPAAPPLPTAGAVQPPRAETPTAPTAVVSEAQNAAFVRAVYRDTIGAAPAQAALNGWLQALNGGASREQVAAGILTSPEYSAAIADAAFRRLLDRPAADAASAWLEALRRGAPPEQLVASVLGSDEFYNRLGATPEAWIAAAYRDVLGRDPTPAETAAQATALASGAKREDIAYALSRNDEFRRRFLDASFRQYLGRPPTEAELNWLLSVMAAGQTSSAVRAALLGSDEYLRRHAPT